MRSHVLCKSWTVKRRRLTEEPSRCKAEPSVAQIPTFQVVSSAMSWPLHTDCSALHWLTPVGVLQLKVKPGCVAVQREGGAETCSSGWVHLSYRCYDWSVGVSACEAEQHHRTHLLSGRRCHGNTPPRWGTTADSGPPPWWNCPQVLLFLKQTDKL